MSKKSESSPSTNWSGRVTRESHALAPEDGVFNCSDPKKIALSLRRVGKNLDKKHLRILEQAEELRKLYGKSRHK